MSQKTVTDPKKIDEVLERGVEDVIVKEILKKELLSGRQLSIYLGTDPTASDLHLGHATIHRKLRDFQELGHKVTLLVGDFTVLVGDHSDKDDQRLEITKNQIEQNMQSYKEQFGKTVDLSMVEVVYNSKWLSELNFNGIIELAKVFTLQQMAERDAFVKRMKAQKPIGFDELLYPIMQGYDAYSLKTDIQIGGTDQLFNLQAGRKIMEHFGMKPQSIVTCPLLIGNDGRKMGKSLKNFISIKASAKEMFFGVMGIVDEIIINYFVSLTRVPMEEINDMEKALKEGSVNPMELKLKLAFEITKFFHNEKDAIKARQEFKEEVQEGNVPKEIKAIQIKNTEIDLADALVQSKVVLSKGEARRLAEQNAIEAITNGKSVIVNAETLRLSLKANPVVILTSSEGTVIRVGKKFVRIVT